ncbi:hypothetical protein ILUMI_00277 [Ignelater luminosus]|uniref:Regulatory protein zeste n=1 Tax=Ignelater luminosus TaxID=2038154 RepID=A0A8K0DM71_IGNLU|nr:hypothetical protein ILUMI_00277 [Ignelater luminosus]
MKGTEQFLQCNIKVCSVITYVIKWQKLLRAEAVVLRNLKHLMFEIVRNKYLHIVDNKITEAVNIEQKNVAWEHIVNEYNCQAQTGPRTSKQLRALYDILKKNARSNLNEDKYIIFTETFSTTDTGAKSTSTPQKSVQEESNCSFLANGMYHICFCIYTINTEGNMKELEESTVNKPRPSQELPYEVPSSVSQQSTSSYGQKRKLSKISEKKKTQLEILTN